MHRHPARERGARRASPRRARPPRHTAGVPRARRRALFHCRASQSRRTMPQHKLPSPNRQERPPATGRCAASLPPATVQLLPHRRRPQSRNSRSGSTVRQGHCRTAAPKRPANHPPRQDIRPIASQPRSSTPRTASHPSICCAASSSARRSGPRQPGASCQDQRAAQSAPHLSPRARPSARQNHDAPTRSISVISTPRTASRPSICCAASSSARRSGPILS